MISFRALETKDFPLWHNWLNQPHMREFFQTTPISLDEVERKYAPRTKPGCPTRCLLAVLDDTPVGYRQSYKNASYPNYAAEIEVTDGISIDYCIGNPAYLGRGIGADMLRAFLDTQAFHLFHQETKCYICHEIANEKALRCVTSAGFTLLRDVIDEGKPSRLFVYDRKTP